MAAADLQAKQAREDIANLTIELRKIEAHPQWKQGPDTAYYREVKGELAMAERELANATARPYLDHIYGGRGVPIPTLWPGEPDWEKSELIGGAFHVKRLLADEMGAFAAVIDNGEGAEWMVFDLAELEKVA